MSTRCAQQVALRRLHCCFFNLQASGFKHFVISQKLLGHSTWVNALCSAGCAAPTRLLFLQFARIRFYTFCHISKTIAPIDISVNALCWAGCAASPTLLFLQFARIRFKTFCHISKTIKPVDLSVYALCSAGCAASTTLLFLQFASIRF